MAKQFDRACYLLMRVMLQAGYLATSMLAVLLPRSSATSRPFDLALFPYYPPGFPGYDARFGNYLALFERDGVRVQLHPPAERAQLEGIILEEHRKWERYLLYGRLYWRRLAQLFRARRAKAAFVQRGLFPYYPDQSVPHLERLLRRLVPNTVIDFYDADYAHNPVIVDACIGHFDTVSVVNAHLEARFRRMHPRVCVLPLTLEVDAYPAKQDYRLGDPVRLFWVGNPGNAVKLARIRPVLERLSRQRRLELLVVCREPVALEGVPVLWQRLDDEPLRAFMPTTDIAIYAAEDVETDRGKMALKVLEYMAAALPIVASPQGLSPEAVHEESLLIADDDATWERALLRLMDDADLRRRLGTSARAAVARWHSAAACYPRLREIVFG